jgi:hypothetical protein
VVCYSARGACTQARERTAAEVKSEWLEGFDISGDVEGCATRSDFVKFYTHLSAAMGAAAANTHASTSSSNSDEAFAAIVRGTWRLGADVGADVAPWRVTFDSPSNDNTGASSEHDHYHSGSGEHGHNSAGDSYDLSQQLQQQQQHSNNSSSNNNYTAAAAAEQLNPRDAAIARAGAQGALPPPPAVHRAGVETGLAGYNSVRTTASGTTANSTSAALRSTTSSRDGSLPFGLQAVVRKLRTAVTGSRGVRGIAALQRALRAADSDSDGRVTLAEFKHALHTTLSTTATNNGGISGSTSGSTSGLSEAELRMLHAHFDTDGCGSCATADIAAAVRVPLQHRRAACVRAAFSKLQHATVAAAGAAGTGAYLTGLGLVDATAAVR